MLVIIDYGMGNVASVKKAFVKLGVKTIISNNKSDLSVATHLVLPGVGAFGDGMKNLLALNVMELLKKRVLEEKTPFLGICLGMQLLAEKGYEFGEHKGLGWIKGQVIKLQNVDQQWRLPHVGWNEVTPTLNNKLFKNIIDKNFYFVHSYHFDCSDKKVISSTCEYSQNFTASLEQDNIFGAQFHPEKSQLSGLQLLKNFIELS